MSILDPGDFAYADEQHYDAGSDRGQGADPDARPAPEDVCVYCGGFGWFEDPDGEGLDGDVPCSHCDQSGLEPA